MQSSMPLQTALRMLPEQEHFKRQKPEKTAAQLARQQAALLASVPEEQRGRLNADILNAATELGMVCWSLPCYCCSPAVS